MQSAKDYCVQELNPDRRYSQLQSLFIEDPIPEGTQYFSLNYDSAIVFYDHTDTELFKYYPDQTLYKKFFITLNCVIMNSPVLFFIIDENDINVIIDIELFKEPLCCPLHLKMLQEDYYIPEFHIPQPIPAIPNLSENMSADLYDYQKNNVQWMMNIEKGTQTIHDHDVSQANLQRIITRDGFKCYQHYVTQVYVPQCIEERIQSETLTIKGGVLADDTGLGKTVTAISLVLSTLDRKLEFFNDPLSKKAIEKKWSEFKERKSGHRFVTDCTVVFCPKSILGQWYDMFLQFTKGNSDLRIYKITNITSYKKLTPAIVCNLDVLLIPYEFITSKSFREYEANGGQILIGAQFKRLIADEFHEIAEKSHRYVITEMTYRYKWLLTASPFSRNCIDNIRSYINMIFDRYYDSTPLLSHTFIEKFIEKMVRRNTVDTIKEHLVLPNITYHLVNLQQTRLERALYLDRLGDWQGMIRLCTSIYASDCQVIKQFHEPLVDMQNRICDEYLKEITKLEEIIEKFQHILSHNSKWKADETDPQLQSLRNIKISRIGKKIKKHEDRLQVVQKRVELFKSVCNSGVTMECPICYDDIEKIAMTSCGHIFCDSCITKVLDETKDCISCPCCRKSLELKDIGWSHPECGTDVDPIRNKWGTKIAWIVNFCQEKLLDPTRHIIVFSQYNKVLKVIEMALHEIGVSSKTLTGGSASIDKKTREYHSGTIKILLMSLQTCNSGVNLPETTDIIMVDTVNARDAVTVEKQAIGRAYRLGNGKDVNVHRLVMSDTIEEENYLYNEHNYPTAEV